MRDVVIARGCAYVAGDPINFRDPWGLKGDGTGGDAQKPDATEAGIVHGFRSDGTYGPKTVQEESNALGEALSGVGDWFLETIKGNFGAYADDPIGTTLRTNPLSAPYMFGIDFHRAGINEGYDEAVMRTVDTNNVRQGIVDIQEGLATDNTRLVAKGATPIAVTALEFFVVKRLLAGPGLKGKPQATVPIGERVPAASVPSLPLLRMPRAGGADVRTIRVRHFTRRNSLAAIEDEMVLRASDQNSVFTVRARGKPKSPRDTEELLGIKRGKGEAYIEFDAIESEFTIVKGRGGAQQYVFEGDVSLEGRNPEFIHRR